jgi:hypothetical protein
MLQGGQVVHGARTKAVRTIAIKKRFSLPILQLEMRLEMRLMHLKIAIVYFLLFAKNTIIPIISAT